MTGPGTSWARVQESNGVPDPRQAGHRMGLNRFHPSKVVVMKHTADQLNTLGFFLYKGVFYLISSRSYEDLNSGLAYQIMTQSKIHLYKDLNLELVVLLRTSTDLARVVHAMVDCFIAA